MSKRPIGEVLHGLEVSGSCFEDLDVGYSGPLFVMVCRRWDCNSVTGRYMSTDYIFSDNDGHCIHATARSNIAHYFVDKLVEGGVYVLKNFSVQTNRSEYRILKDSRFMIELQGSTVVRKVPGVHEGFVRYPFSLVELEDLQVTGNKYFVDVIGYVLSVGSIIKQASGRETLEFQLHNERGRFVPVTLWGKLGDALLQQKQKKTDPYAVILTSMSVKYYLGGLTMSSSSSTLILDSNSIPLVGKMNASLRHADLRQAPQAVGEQSHKAGTLFELLQMARQNKNQAAFFRGGLTVTNVRVKNSWFNFTCNGGRCRKGVVRKNGSFWCEACDMPVMFPRARYRLQLDVKDATAHVVIVLFDECGEHLLKRTAKSLLDDQDAVEDDSVLPNVLKELVGQTFVVELKARTYYQYGEYESFNCSQVLVGDASEPPESSEREQNPEVIPKESSSSAGLKHDEFHVVTPVKKSEGKGKAIDPVPGTPALGDTVVRGGLAEDATTDPALTVPVKNSTDGGVSAGLGSKKRLRKAVPADIHSEDTTTNACSLDYHVDSSGESVEDELIDDHLTSFPKGRPRRVHIMDSEDEA
ncbi:hypothetical protein SSX86_007279 [Deinandra increscens subsp. villosa]|uniref:Replication factor A C-terminal domain-containing protein n=1 Tax=Deinandra increscens subsp. villosa TaxID=3103831 RepID=A0AAP0CNQ7_9ASTR